MANLTREQRLARDAERSLQQQETQSVEQPPEGCIFMFKDGERAAVNTAHDSVQIMTAHGWSVE